MSEEINPCFFCGEELRPIHSNTWKGDFIKCDKCVRVLEISPEKYNSSYCWKDSDKWKSLAGDLAKTIRVLHDMFEEVKDGEPNGKYVLNRHRFLVRDSAAKAREAGL